MRRIAILAMVIMVLVGSLGINASAASAATKVSVYAAVSGDGSAQVTMTCTVRLEQSEKDLIFCVPAEASGVTLNGKKVWTTTKNNAKQINLSNSLGGMAGAFTFTIIYSLDDVVHTNEAGLPEMQLPLLSGFKYPVEYMDFTVAMPGEVSEKPAFSSGYHKASIEQDLAASVSGSTITGQSTKPLKDQETLTMTLIVPPRMFPKEQVIISEAAFDDICMIVFAVLALLYWLLTMRTLPVRWRRFPAAPEGYSAGELRSILTLQGADLTMMIFTWAQLGYVMIQPERSGRVILHRRMEMGNERSEYEQRLYKSLFGGRRTVDTTSYRYAMLCQKASKVQPNLQGLVHRRSGNRTVFRVLAAMISLFGGIAVGIALGAGQWIQWPLVVLMAAFGGVSGWVIQMWADNLLLRDRTQTWIGLGLSALWILLGIIGGQWVTALWMVISQLIAGLLLSYGGRRTEAGKQAVAQAMGLRWYFMTASKEEVKRITMLDPEYYHTMAPYALAMGVDKAFAKRFGSERIPPCPYLGTSTETSRSAKEWSELMRRTAAAMDSRNRKMPLERVAKVILSFRK